ncbi:MAG: hypothetical protein K0S01_2962 [Herbinix sp.]|jgi:uncharacterized protein|nr:hypothetical protein [Herbinix sp.]
MIKKCYAILVLLLLVGSINYKSAAAETALQPTDAFYVNDFADVINDEVEDKIVQYGNQLSEQSGAQIVLVTIDFTDGKTLENYAMELFNEWGIGSKEKNNGLLMLLSIGDDDYWAMQGEGLEDTLTSGKISSILQEYLEPDFAAKDYSAGAEKVYGAFVQELGGQWKADTDTSVDTSEEEADTTTYQYIYDEAKILSKKSEQSIQDKSSEAQELYGAGFYVVTKDKAEDGLSFQEDTINTFEEINAGSRDALLVLYKDDDNYWLLPGNEAEEFATVDVISNILDRVLEPNFASKEYSVGAIKTADEFYDLFKENYKKVDAASSDIEGSSNNIEGKNTEVSSKNITQIYPMLFLILVLLILLIRSRRRRHFRNVYGIPFNPYAPRYIRHYGPEGYWGRQGRPMGYGNWNDGMNTQNGYNMNNGYNTNNGAGRSSENHSWGSSGGAGRSSAGGSWESSSDNNQSSSGSMFSGGGGTSRGGGAGRSSGSTGNSSGSAGRSSSSIGRSGPSGRSSGGGRSSSGGGGASRGGGAGRK